MNDPKGATEFANKVGKPEVFSELGKSQLDQGQLSAAIKAFIEANDPSMFERILQLAQSNSEYDDLISYLLMARKTLKNQKIDNEIIFTYAKGEDRYLAELEGMISEPN